MKYEIIHDTIARQVFEKASNEQRQRRKIEKYIRDKYEFYKDRKVLLTQDDLDYINPYIPIVAISEVEKDFIEKSRFTLREIDDQERKAQTKQLEKEKRLREQAEEHYQKAKKAVEEANRLRKIAETETQNALMQKQQAEKARDEVKKYMIKIVIQQLDEVDRYILRLEYEKALEILNGIVAKEMEAQKIIQKYQEIAYWYSEGEDCEIAIDILDNMLLELNLGKQEIEYENQLAQAKQKKGKMQRLQLRKLYKMLDHTHFEEVLEKRYYPDMIYIKGGVFLMGEETNIQRITLSDYKIARTPTTIFQFSIFCRAKENRIHGYKIGDYWDANWSKESWGDKPIVNVLWDETFYYSEWLNKRVNNMSKDLIIRIKGFSLGRKKRVKINWSKKSYRLPTEAEWEYAARGGEKEIVTRYAGSNKLDEVAWYDGNSNKCPQSVRQKKPNELELYDMSGNVLEWCYDRYSIQKSKSLENPKGSTTGSFRVLRGGSWYNNDKCCSIFFRMKGNPVKRYYNDGFRLAYSL